MKWEIEYGTVTVWNQAWNYLSGEVNVELLGLKSDEEIAIVWNRMCNCLTGKLCLDLFDRVGNRVLNCWSGESSVKLLEWGIDCKHCSSVTFSLYFQMLTLFTSREFIEIR